MRSGVWLAAALAAGCAAHEGVSHLNVAPAGLRGVEAVRAATATGQFCVAFSLLQAVDPQVGPEAVQSARAALVASALTEVERLRALRQMEAWEQALALLAHVAAVDPGREGLRQEVQREFDAYLWEAYLKREQAGTPALSSPGRTP